MTPIADNIMEEAKPMKYSIASTPRRTFPLSGSLTAALTITLLALALHTSPAFADSAPPASPEDIALAEKAFNEGIELAQAGNCKEAIVKLELSQKIDPASGTALNLGRCYEMLGRTASAYGAYSQSAGLARIKVNDKIRGEAEQAMTALAPSLSNLELRLAPNTTAPEGLSITIDGKAISTAALGTGVPVDPGTRVVEASAPGKKTFKTSVVIAAKPGNTALEIPGLEDAPAAPATNPKGMSTGALAATVSLAGLGAVMLGVGIGFGVDSMDKNSASKKLCSAENPNLCSARRGGAARSGVLVSDSVECGVRDRGGGAPGGGRRPPRLEAHRGERREQDRQGADSGARGARRRRHSRAVVNSRGAPHRGQLPTADSSPPGITHHRG
ncbi:MAG: hypothetical protein R3F14_34385 [Polyangiaceae bacterium]